MANTIAIKRRITSVRSTRQITRAQQMVAASKLRAATAAALSAAEYRAALDTALSHVAASDDWAVHPLVQNNDSNVTRIVLIGSDRGLAGAYHSRLEIAMREAIAEYAPLGPIEIETIGTKAAQIAARFENVNVVARNAGLGVLPSVWEISGTVSRLVQAYANGEVGRIVLIATHFKSALTQYAEKSVLLPLSNIEATPGVPATLEPNAETAIAEAIQARIQAVMYDGAANALASEQAMRMVAMENATNNANDLIDDLTLEFNNARQAAITQELAEISGGVAALSD